MSGQLSQSERDWIFDNRIIPELKRRRDKAGRVSADGLRFVSVGGQPGAGKTVAVLNAEQAHAAVSVDMDQMRTFHPDFRRLAKTDALKMVEVTQSDGGYWTGRAIAHLRDRRVSTVVETTLREPDVQLREFTAFKAAGYETELRIVAVPEEVSRASTVSRYLNQVNDRGSGRFTTLAAHDVCFANGPDTVRKMIEAKLVDAVYIQNRDGEILFSANTKAGGSQLAKTVSNEMVRARQIDLLDPQAAKDWLEKTFADLSTMKQIGATGKEFTEVTQRLASVDVKAVVVQAFPDNIEAQQKVVEQFSVFRVSSTDRGLRALSFPTSVTEANRRPHAGPSAPAPRQIHREPGIDGPGVSR